MMRLARLAAMLAAALVAIGATPLPQDIYIWQRLWTPGVTGAALQAEHLFSGWRVLAAETDPNGHLRSFAINWNVLQDKPITVVLRIDGTLARQDQTKLLADIRRVATGWPKSVALEIDYDCGTAQLPTYGRLLKEVRKLRSTHLAITVLPAWMESRDLAALLAIPDEAVLQVHAVRSPSQGLFDARLARRWIDHFDQITSKPFRVALPDYGTRVIRGQHGDVLAMESESPRLITGVSAEELLAEPSDVAALVRDLQRTTPHHLAGLTWFRLPVAGDHRIWSLQTLSQVMHGDTMTSNLVVETRQGVAPGAVDILLVNRGTNDVLLPRLISLPASCKVADGVGAYRYEAQRNGLRRLQNALLPRHHEIVIGWARCGAGNFHVEP
jgi:hypothetical protein